MIEQIIYDYLNNSGLTAYMEIPEGGGARPFCVIEKTGSGETDHIKQATIAVQSYAGSLYKAAALNETVKELMAALPTLDDVAACELNTDYNFTDTAKKQYRYQAVFDVVHY